jgi:hypothetical protein
MKRPARSPKRRTRYRRIDVDTLAIPIRDFIRKLGVIRRPIDLTLNGTVVAILVPPAELSDAEKQHILDAGWAVVEKARAHAKDIPASVIQKEVAAAVREVRARRAKRGR